MFKTAGALHSLSPLLKLSNDVVKAKAYLLLAYIVSLNDSDEYFNHNGSVNISNNNLINNISNNNTSSINNNSNRNNNSSNNISNNSSNAIAATSHNATAAEVISMADDITAFIVSILRDALLNTNHFSPRLLNKYSSKLYSLPKAASKRLLKKV